MFQNTGVTFMVSGNINPNLRKGFFWFLSNSLKIIDTLTWTYRWTYRDGPFVSVPLFSQQSEPETRGRKQKDRPLAPRPLAPQLSKSGTRGQIQKDRPREHYSVITTDTL